MSLEQEHQSLALGRVWRQGANELRQAAIEEADADAELLLLYLLGMSKAELLRDWREPMPASKGEAWEAWLKKRKSGVPVQYIVGEQHFYGRVFEVSDAVLIPRPETELLVEAVMETVDRLWMEELESPVILDVGTGSGALAVTIAAERPGWHVIASDLSDKALAVAKRNAARHGVHAGIPFVQGDLLTPFLLDNGAGAGYPPIDVLISNPPYIPSSDIDDLQREVRDFEPRLALDGGQDGLNPYRLMADQLQQLSKMPRVVAWEVGAGQAEAAAELLRAAADWGEIRFVKDYAGIDRHVIAVRVT